MDRCDVRWLRLAVTAGAIAGSALVSSTVVATDESPTTDESIVVEAPPDLPLEDIAVIDLVIVHPDLTENAASGSDGTEALLGDTASDAEGSEVLGDEPVVEMLAPGPVLEVLAAEGVVEVLAGERVAALLEHVDAQGGSEPEGDGGGSEHDVDEGESGHEGGKGGAGGQGTPFLMSFEVVWLDPDGTEIGVVDAVLPADWSSLFELSASSQTGSGKPTTATCVYTEGSDLLQCEYVNKGHGAESDGLIIPASKKATYAVVVVWSPTDWTIDGANDGPYSARKTCGVDGHGGSGGDGGDGGDGHDEGAGGSGGHDEGASASASAGGSGSGSDGGDDSDGGGERRTVPCTHKVLMRQVVVPPTKPPAVDPEPEVTPVVPEAIAPVVREATSPVVPDSIPSVVTPTEVADVVAAAPVAAAVPKALPATGSSVSVLLVLAGLLVVAGSTVALFSRRTS